MTVNYNCDIAGEGFPLPHFWEEIVGSDHAPIALRKDWQEQLSRCKKELGFKYVRFHGILSDDMYTLVHKDEKKTDEPPVYSFFNIDQVIDFLLSIDVRPFMELSFMPTAISSGKDTVFSYKGNINPPKNYKAWENLIRKLLTHLIERYGIEEVRKWFFEVWNEPNLKAFWKANQAEYFKLYKHTAKIIKELDKGLRVGGPATAKNEWIPEFLAFCKDNRVPCDFISTHHYPTDAFGKAGDDTITQLAKSKRSILQEQARKVKEQAGDKPVYYTEWSTSSNPFDELHDQPYAAAYIIKTIMEARGLVEGYSYWTFSDIFTENYLSSKPFHGGFGLLTIYNIPKPAYRAFQLLHQLGDQFLQTEGKHETVDVWTVRKKEKINIVITNGTLPKHPIKTESIKIELKNIEKPGRIFMERIDETHANANKEWNDMGKPGSLKDEQIAKLEAASGIVQEPLTNTYRNNNLYLELDVPPQGVACITIELPSVQPEGNTPVAESKMSDTDMLNSVQKESFEYFLKESNPDNGLIKDNTETGSQASIASVGMALSCYVAAIENGFITRANAIKKILTVLRFFYSSHQGSEPDATGYKGFYYHFLDMQNGKRTSKSELSTIDTAILMAGILTCANYFTEENKEENEIRKLADQLYTRVDWQWALNDTPFLTHGWKPESGFLPNAWDNTYSEAHILYVLALGSPTFPIPPDGYKKWVNTFEWKKLYGIEYFYAGPLFIHQMSQVWLDLKDLKDEMNKKSGIDYFENSRRATYIQQKYAIENPNNFFQYSEDCWGFTASNGPGPYTLKVNGLEREFYNYTARAVPFGPDDGTISPCAAVCSLPFAPDIVLRSVRYSIENLDLKKYSKYGFDASFNPTFPDGGPNPFGWISPLQYALNQGPVVLMIENYKSRLIWETMKKCKYIIKGLKQAGFKEGWLDNKNES